MATTLANAQYLNLATFRKDGTEVHTPVWFAQEGDTYYLFSNGDAGKVKRLRNSPRARAAPCDVRGKLLGDWQEGQATLLAGPEAEHAHRALRRKYGFCRRPVRPQTPARLHRVAAGRHQPPMSGRSGAMSK